MLFNSIIFTFYFLPIVLIGFYWCRRLSNPQAPLIFLIVASLVFYGAWEPRGVLILLVSIGFNYSVGVALIRAPAESPWRLVILLAGIAGDVTLLAYFKYAIFIVQNVTALTGLQFAVGTIILPLAISFFTFTQIAFLVDAYRGDVRDIRFVQYAMFVTFFPHLIAGPIYHHKEMIPQFDKFGTGRIDPVDVAVGIALFTIGLFKKIAFADTIAPYANSVFGAAAGNWPLTFFEAWGGVLSFLFQIYFDFSGYTDMALGLALLFGVRMPVNFNSPYKATSIIDFWQRWHITLTRFLTDYIYSPIALSLARKGMQRRAGLLAIFMLSIVIPANLTFLISGIWHGAGWNFVIFGAINGIALTINYAWRQTRPFRVPAALGWALTIVTFTASLVFFRATTFDSAVLLIKGMIGLHGFTLPAAYADALGGVATLLKSLGWRFDDIVLAYLKLPRQFFYLVALFAFVLLLPNSQQILARFHPVLDDGRRAGDRSWWDGAIERAWLVFDRMPPRLITGASVACGTALAAAICSMLIGQSWLRTQVAQFIYFQF